MMFMRLLCCFWAFLFRVIAAEFQPKVTKTSGAPVFYVTAFDDSTTLLGLQPDGLLISFDNGVNWKKPDGIPPNITMVDIDEHYRHLRAVAIDEEGQFYLTEDQGKQWKRLQLPTEAKDELFCELDTHPFEKDYFLARCTKCPDMDFLTETINMRKRSMFMPPCQISSYASNNGGKSFKKIESPKHESSADTDYLGLSCEFVSKSTDSTLSSNRDLVYCLDSKMDKLSGNEFAAKISGVLFYTNDFGKSSKVVDQFEDSAVSDFQVLNSHILVYTLEDRFNRWSATNLWVSGDGFNFGKAYLPTILRDPDTYGTKEDELGRIIMPTYSFEEDDPGTSQILISDSSGLQFHVLQLTTENNLGFIMLETSKTLKGTMWADLMSLVKGPQNSFFVYPSSKVSFDYGDTWSNLKVVASPNQHKDLFACDVADVENCSLKKMMGFIDDAATGETAGILMTVGTVGSGDNDMLNKPMTFISRDGGKTWEVAFEYPCLYAFGDLGNIIVAMPYSPDEDMDPQGEFYYSLDQGRTWKEYQLEVPILPLGLISTTPDGSGLNFIVSSFKLDLDGKNSMGPLSSDTPEGLFYTIDFADAFNGKVCGSKDFEPWYLAGGECVNGAKYSYNRRKQDSQCLVRKLFENLALKEEACDQCTEKDYECSSGFSRDGNGVCKLDLKAIGFSPECMNSGKNSVRVKPIVKQPGNKCRKEIKVDPVEVPCNTGKEIVITENNFKSKIQMYQYFDTKQDETLIFDTTKDGVYISHDSGQTLKQFNPGENIVEIVFNAYHDSYAYLFGQSGKLYVTRNRCRSFAVTELPHSRQLGLPLEFHAKNPDIFIYYGGKNCEDMFNPSCHPVAYITTDGGKSFAKLLDNAIHCEFAGSLLKQPVNENLIYCQVKEPKTRKRTLMSSTDFFNSDSKVVLDKIIGYMSTGEFIVAAVPYGENELRAYVTVDGVELAEAKFPGDLTATKQESFTVLGSETGSIFFHLTTFDEPGYEYGALMKSNSNGTSFVKLQSAVNRNLFGMVDFEKVQALEGIILINVVDNFEKVGTKSEDKKLKSMITFNDGSDWSYIRAPSKDCYSNSYSCNTKKLEKCSLHLHGYTEREDVRDTLFSGSAFGMLIGNGNVGEYLLPEDQSSTFFSKDGGETWREVRKGPHQWEFGDHGGIIVLVPKNSLTDKIYYSIDMGETWLDYSLGQKFYVQDIVTVPGDSALRFLLIASSSSVNGGSVKTLTLDFYNKFDRQCSLNPDRPDSGDFKFFSLGQSDSNCLFGHQEKYLMKDSSDCFVGNAPLSEFYEITKNCSCTRADFECDYNYFKAGDGTCKLVEGLSPADPSDICKKQPDLIEYFQPTGYRKIPLSTCVGGLRLDGASSPLPCPGKQKDFKEIHGVNSIPYFFTFLMFFLILLAIAWFVYDRGIRRNGGFARFGEIRLDGDDLIENNNTDKMVNSIVKSGFYAASAVFSSYQLVKRAIGRAAWKLSEKFGRRRGPTYSSLLHDQFLDEADDLLTGHDEDANDLGSFLANQGNFEIEDEDNELPQRHVPFTDEPHAESAEPTEPTELPKTSEPAEPGEISSPPPQENNNDEPLHNKDDEEDLGTQ
ncbi:hypothetical protein ZYGR_0AI05570 [Zygosaccharomyces rouxii]|uniref:VPS10 domain-containing protein n=1 Tax=Zygosaccharomyces rouxii TaxID=4956 RepID=A0A1Q3ACQ0_ZYGRO|nr:hypothetical protein ZYGR_0AI05570 [Zygosaccharomyces rouxii]